LWESQGNSLVDLRLISARPSRAKQVSPMLARHPVGCKERE
jgi:hypothetical protein